MPRPADENSAFSHFEKSTEIEALAEGLTFLLDNTIPHPLCLLAVSELQLYLQDQQEWNHRFGLHNPNLPIGSMVIFIHHVVRNAHSNLRICLL